MRRRYIDSDSDSTESDSSKSDAEGNVSSASDDDGPEDDENGRPLQLISFQRSDDFEETLSLNLNSQVLESVLETCKDKPICIINIVGQQRSGKSLLANYIKDRLVALEDEEEGNWLSRNRRLTGFEWRHGYKQQTKGIWIWSRAFIVDADGKDVAVLLIDTQGINDFTTPEEISAIIGIPLLLSSITIVNVISEIPDEALDWLSISTKFGNLRKETTKHFQKLSFLVRDWTRLSDYAWGDESGERYLASYFRENQKESKKLKKCWEEIECCLLPHIGSKALVKAFTGNPNELDKEFSKRLVSYIQKLTEDENLATKRIWGNEIGAEELKMFTENYVKLFNNKGELELGIKPESILAANSESAEKIKVGRGLTAFKQVYADRIRATGGEFLRDATIDGMHSQARDRALDAFGKFSMPKEKERSMERLLDELLEKENEKLKTDNEGARRRQIAENRDTACENLRAQLSEVFPFTPEPGTNIPESMVFYEPELVQGKAMELMGITKFEFLEKFASDDEDEVQILNQTIDSVLQPIVQEYCEKNLENRETAEKFAKQAKEKLQDEYLKAMQKRLDRLPDMTANTLNLFHEEEIDNLEKKFKTLHLGTPKYQKKWLDELLEDIENEHETMLMGLESIMAAALNLVNQEAQKYRQELQGKAEELEDEQEMKEFHIQSVAAIRRKLKANCPFPEDSPKGEALFRKLENQLQSAFSQVVEDGIMVKRQMEETLQNEMQFIVANYRETIEMLINEKGFVAEQELAEYLTDNKNLFLATFASKVEDLALEKATIENAKSELTSKLEQSDKEFKSENEQRRLAATSQADLICSEILASYNTKMMSAVGELSSIDDLVLEHTKLISEIEKNFKERCPSKNQVFIKEQITKVTESAEKAFAEVEKFFVLTKQTENVGLMTALLTVRSDYVENMNRHFANKNGYFSPDELESLHNTTKSTAMKKIEGDSSISAAQRREIDKKLEEAFKDYKDRNDLVFQSFEGHDPAIGIDLGTTYCCVAVYFQGRVQTVRNAYSGEIIPSYVRIDDDDTKVFGTTAKDEAYKSPENTIFDAKRIIGRRWDDPNLQSDMKYWPFSVVDDDGPKIEVNGKKYYPEQISAFLLEHLKKEAIETLGRNITKAIITVPAYFTDGQRQATERAGEIAGLEVLGILNEPTAAAVAYRQNYCFEDAKKNILVYDLGGGTFDVAILELSKSNINVLSVGGDDHLGGEDFDKNLMAYCANEYKTKTGIDLFLNKDSTVKQERDDCRRRLRRLQTMCEESKKKLASLRSHVLSVAAFVGTEDLIVEITRKKFEELNMGHFKKTLKIVDDTLKSANLTKEQIDEIVLVGGSTRIPKLQEMLVEHFDGKALSKKINPDEAVAHGAALQAAIKCAKPGEKLFDFGAIQEVTPRSLGIEMANKEFDIIIPKNTRIPTTHKQVYETHRDNQDSAWIRIFQGEEKIAANNKLLGDFTLEGIPKNKAGLEKVQVSININANGIMNVEAECQSTKGSKKITVCQEKGIMSEETKKRIIQEGRPVPKQRGSTSGT